MSSRTIKQAEALAVRQELLALCDNPKDNRSLERLTKLLESFNSFDVLRSSGHEIRHSNMLAWLLDPKGSHGLGTVFLEGFLRAVEKQSPNRTGCLRLLASPGADLEECEVEREHKYRDLQLKFPTAKVVIIIENKWDSDEGVGERGEEHTGQLRNYASGAHREFGKSYECLFVFLTPDGRLPQEKKDQKTWGVLGYDDVYDILAKVLSRRLRCRRFLPQKLLIDQYRVIVGRKVGRMVQEFKLCDELYAKYPNALDFIAEHRFHVRNKVIEKLAQGVDINGKCWNCGKRCNTYIQYFKRCYAVTEKKLTVHYEVEVHDSEFHVALHVEGKAETDAVDLRSKIKARCAKNDLEFIDKSSKFGALAARVRTLGRDPDEVLKEVKDGLATLFRHFEKLLIRNCRVDSKNVAK